MASRLGSLAIDIIANTSGLRVDLDKARGELGSFKSSAQNMGDGLGKLRGPLTSIVVGLTGVSGATGRLASTFLSLAAGSGPVVLLTAGIGGLVALYRHLTKETRETAEATEKFTESMEKAAKLRADPGGLIEGIGTAQRRLKDLDKQLTDLRSKSASAGLGGDVIFGADITKTLAEIAKTQKAVEEGKRSLALSGEQLVTSLSREVAVLELGEPAVKRLNLANLALDPSVRKAALALHDQIQTLTAQKKASEEAADAVKRHRQEQEKITAAILANQRAWRIEAAGGGNLTQMAGGTVNQGALTGGLLSGASADEITASRGLASDKNFEAARLFQETWINAIRGAQGSLADFFKNLGKQGTGLIDLLSGILDTVKNMLAELAAMVIIRGIFGGLTGGLGAGLGGALSRGNLTQSNALAMNTGGMAGMRALDPPRALPSGGGQTVNVTQAIAFNVAAMDGASVAAMLRSQKATIAGVVAEAASEAPRFAAHIVRSGTR